MEFADALRRRAMTRDFLDTPLADDDLEYLLDAATRMPSAGRAQGCSFVVLRGPDTSVFWDATLPESRRGGFAWPGLLRAPVILVACADPRAYLARYREPDKAAIGLGDRSDSWPVPYWTVDGGMAVGALLLAAADRGFGALFFAVFHGEAELRRALDIPDDVQVLGAIALGYKGSDERRGRSASRPRRTDVAYERLWGAPPSARRSVSTSDGASDTGASQAQSRQT